MNRRPAKPYEQLSYREQLHRLRGLARQAVELHGIEDFELVTLAHAENTTFRVRAGRAGDFLCRIHRPGYQTFSNIRSELAWLKALGAEAGLLVPAPLLDEPIEVAAPGLESRLVVLFRWLEGRFSGRPSVAEFRRLGSMMAKLHWHATSFDIRSIDRSVLDLEGLAGGAMGGALTDIPSIHRKIFERTVERVRGVFDGLGTGADIWGLIHADLHPGNRLTVNKRPAAIDFDDCGFGYFLYDFAVALDHARRRHPESYPKLRDALFVEYRKLRPITDAHIALLPAFFAIRAVTLALWLLHRSKDHPHFRQRAPGYISDNADGLAKLHADPAW